MIIWGSKAKEHRTGTGAFYCPRCQGEAPYDHMTVSRYFTLYFIPLFPTSTLGSYVRCGACKGDYKPEILQISPEMLAQAVEPWTCNQCGNRNAPSYDECLSCNRKRFSGPPPLPALAEAGTTE